MIANGGVGLESRLAGCLEPYDSAVVAFSGGVDSALVAAVAHRVWGERALAVTGCSPSLAAADRQAARQVANAIGIRHEEIATHEIDAPGYRANAGDRCFHCKSELYARLAALAERRGYAVVLDGTHTGDLVGHRPGLRAASEAGVRAPLVEAGFGKAEVRALARALGLAVWDLPANACLASRLPVGTPVTTERLERVARAEAAVKELGYSQVRVRDHGGWARLELGQAELERGLAEAERLIGAVVRAGFDRAQVDPAGYRPGGADF